MDKQKKNLGAVAFLPLIVFLVCYVGCGITFTLMGVDDPFGKFPRHVALLAGCAVALLLNRSMDVKDKLNIMTTNMGNSGVMMIVLIYLTSLIITMGFILLICAFAVLFLLTPLVSNMSGLHRAQKKSIIRTNAKGERWVEYVPVNWNTTGWGA